MVYTTEQLQYYTSIIRTLPEEQRREARAYIKQLDDPAAADAYLMELTKTAGATESKRKASNTANKSAGSPNKPRKAPRASKAVKSTNKTKTTQNKAVRTTQGGNNTILERVDGETLTNNDILDLESVEAKINQSILNYCISNDMESPQELIKAPQRIWGAVSHYIGRNVFGASRLLYSPHMANKIDINKVIQVLPIYFNLCDRYNKAVLIDYTAYFLGVSEDWIYKHDAELTASSIDLHKKREESLAAGIVDGKQSPVGAIAALNHWHNWTTSTAQRVERTETTVIYPVLVDITKNDVKQVDGANVPKLGESQ